MKTTRVTVVDHVSCSAEVSPEQAAAYVRSKLPSWRESVVSGAGVSSHCYTSPDGHTSFMFPASASAGYYARRMGEVCDTLVALGVAPRPSEVLRAMTTGGKLRPPALEHVYDWSLGEPMPGCLHAWLLDVAPEVAVEVDTMVRGWERDERMHVVVLADHRRGWCGDALSASTIDWLEAHVAPAFYLRVRW